MNVFQKKREEIKLTQEQLALRLSTDRSTVAKWETAASFPRPDMLVKLTTIFNCTADELLGIDRSQRDGETQMSGEELSDTDAKMPEPGKPETREEVIARRMSDAIAGAQQKQEG